MERRFFIILEYDNWTRCSSARCTVAVRCGSDKCWAHHLEGRVQPGIDGEGGIYRGPPLHWCSLIETKALVLL